ncbi:MAG: sialate O-acetylesterase, partial [Planctomycetales bacterium]
KMLEEIREALKNMETDFPRLKGRKQEIAGFVWFQGWNDMFNDEAKTEYEDNLVNLILDVREALGRPKLPAVIGELGNGGEKAGGNMIAIREAQGAAAKRPELKGGAVFVKTTAFARPAEDSPNKGHGHHWFGNAESYFLIGGALGKGMLTLLDK